MQWKLVLLNKVYSNFLYCNKLAILTSIAYTSSNTSNSSNYWYITNFCVLLGNENKQIIYFCGHVQACIRFQKLEL